MYATVSALTHLTLVYTFGFVFCAQNSFSLDPGFDIKSVANAAESLSSHSWEFGTTAEALLELYNPEVSVFGDAPFPVPVLNASAVKSLSYAASKIVIGTGANSLGDGQGAVGDPASLGVSAVLLGKTDVSYAVAARQTVDFMTKSAPRMWNGAISQRVNTPELWADFMYMGPPFVSYYAAATCNADLLWESVLQCYQYRQILFANATHPSQGAWSHIVGTFQDPGLWATGNGWAAAGMTRVLAVISKSSAARHQQWKNQAISQLTSYIQEIVDGAMASPDTNGLLHNYLNETASDGHGFGEISGTSLIAASVYRMAVLAPQVFGSSYVKWADGVRGTLGNGQHIANGMVYPAVNPYDWQDTQPVAQSPEGNSFVVLMYAAWRDCVQVGVCGT